MYDRKTSIEYVESRFPQLSEELHEETWDGLLHLQVAVFSRWAQRVIDDGDRDGWHQVVQVFLDLWHDCTPDVENALNVSFLEHLNFTDGKKPRSWTCHALDDERGLEYDGSLQSKNSRRLTMRLHADADKPRH